MRLHLMSWTEVEAHLASTTGVVVPIGATEQHSPAGLIGTDSICAETLAWGVGETTGAVVAPTISIGMSEHHMGFPGSMTLRPSTLLLVIRDAVLSLARHGFRRFFFINGHGGNTPVIHSAFFEVYSDAPNIIDDAIDLRCVNVEWWTTEAAQRLSAELFGSRDGDHATASEVSLAQFAHPRHIKTASFEDDAQPTSHVFGPADFRRRYPDGRMSSDPALASPDKGATIHRAVVAELAIKYREFLEEI